jgi:hypothetical protein
MHTKKVRQQTPIRDGKISGSGINIQVRNKVWNSCKTFPLREYNAAFVNPDSAGTGTFLLGRIWIQILKNLSNPRLDPIFIA